MYLCSRNVNKTTDLNEVAVNCTNTERDSYIFRDKFLHPGHVSQSLQYPWNYYRLGGNWHHTGQDA